MKEITVQEFEEWRKKKEDFLLIDVREPHEYEEVNLEGENIPLGTIAEHASRIPKDKKVVVHCRSGKRSADAINLLEKQYGFTNLYNLRGGILAYIAEINPELGI
ncbi:MAG: rhodanese-like domain-containing protein [Flammeovirgaceae bacterium]|nr:rhodanese-like domain-containing protein [Flammeovirgaceae bacterium]MDW8286735.1 rhodanese-like domain-containing protein [Flammeovirgaceae bacterium]